MYIYLKKIPIWPLKTSNNNNNNSYRNKLTIGLFIKLFFYIYSGVVLLTKFL